MAGALPWTDAGAGTDWSGTSDRSVRSYFSAFGPAFGPAPEWDELVWWPPDVFMLANLVLHHTESYRFVVAPPAGRRWPPLPDWNEQVRAAARGWRDAVGGSDDGLPWIVRQYWDVVSRCRDLPLSHARSGEAWELTEALLTLHAAADEACSEIVLNGRRAPDGSLEARAWRLLQEEGSLSRLARTRARIVPKSNHSSRGITIRSLSRYLALCYESVEVRWRGVEPELPAKRQDLNMVVIPWPLEVRARDFRPVESLHLENMDTDLFGFFEFAPESPLDCDHVRSLLEAACERAGRVDAVVLPEAAVRPEDVAALEQVLAEHDATVLIAGVRMPSVDAALGRNYLHFGIRDPAGWKRYEQDKHHRWCLDEGQIRQYRLTRSLDPKKLWWEAIGIRERTLHVVDVGSGVTTAPLVCEDLAQLGEVADVVRRIGPSLVVAVLLDGPQIATRWPSRYASVLIDDPGSAVLTVTPYGMAARSKPPGTHRSRVVAHWNSRADGHHEIELKPGAGAILLTTSVETRRLWTADGRSHDDVPALALGAAHQLRAR